jgi:hypothetical protein
MDVSGQTIETLENDMVSLNAMIMTRAWVIRAAKTMATKM